MASSSSSSAPPPLIVQPQPPRAERIDKQKFGLAALVVGLGITLFFALKLQSKHAAQQAIQPAPLPGAHEVSGTDSTDPFLRIPSSYAGIDRTPKPPKVEPPPTTPEPVFAPAVPPPPTPRVAPQAPPPTPVHAAAPPAPPVKTPPKRWLFANMQQSVATPPFPHPKSALPPGEDDQAGMAPGLAPGTTQGTAAGVSSGLPPGRAQTPGARTSGTARNLIQAAQWARPVDPTRVLYRSQTIPGVLMQDVNSDLPGQVKIMVTRPVLDRFGQGQVLIPQYTLLVGQQDGRPVYGQARLGVTIEEMEWPDGTVLGLGKAALADKSGAMGVAGKVNNHWSKVGLGAVLSAVLSIGARAPFGNTTGFQPTLPQEFSQDVGASLSRTGQQVVQRALTVPPTITLTAGTEVSVQLSENLSLQRPPLPVIK